MDPGGTSLYAHNIILHIASELGIPGLIAFASAVVVLLRVRVPADDSLQLWAYAAVLGTGVHQMVDFPIMMPALALSFLVVLAVALPSRTRPISQRYALVVASAAVALIIMGVLRAPLQVK